MSRAVLHVDDEHNFRRMLVRLLADLAPVTSASSINEGLTLLQRNDDWLAFIFDLNLPDGTGWELVARARALYPSTPCLVLTGIFTLEVFQRAQTAEASYLEKSGSVNSIIRFVNDAKNSQNSAADAIHLAASRIGNRCGLSTGEVLLLESEVSGLPRGTLLNGRSISDHTLKTHRKSIMHKARTGSGIAVDDWEDLKRLLLREVVKPPSE